MYQEIFNLDICALCQSSLLNPTCVTYIVILCFQAQRSTAVEKVPIAEREISFFWFVVSS